MITSSQKNPIKLLTFDIPHRIIEWTVTFLQNRKQRVKLSPDCYSERGTVPAGVPWGTKWGPRLFALMINDLDVTDTDLWKHLDDTTISENEYKQQTSTIQSRVHELPRKSTVDKFQLNEDKCKELRISFARPERSFTSIFFNDKPIDVVSNTKVLGVYSSRISSG